MKTYILSCGRARCCPEVHYDEELSKIVITDDDGGIVTMSRQQFDDMRRIKL